MIAQKDQVYRLGKITFRILNASPRLKILSESLLPVVDTVGEGISAKDIVDVDMNDYIDLRPLTLMSGKVAGYIARLRGIAVLYPEAAIAAAAKRCNFAPRWFRLPSEIQC